MASDDPLDSFLEAVDVESEVDLAPKSRHSPAENANQKRSTGFDTKKLLDQHNKMSGLMPKATLSAKGDFKMSAMPRPPPGLSEEGRKLFFKSQKNRERDHLMKGLSSAAYGDPLGTNIHSPSSSRYKKGKYQSPPKIGGKFNRFPSKPFGGYGGGGGKYGGYGVGGGGGKPFGGYGGYKFGMSAKPVSPEEEARRKAAQKAAAIRAAIEEPEDEQVAAEDQADMGVVETFSDYKPAKVTIGCAHPDPVVETASLASVAPPDVTYELSLPAPIVNEGMLSALQLEAVIYATQMHEQFLGDGCRSGYLVGDGAGVGKGRTIAGIIYENWLNGRKRALWISISNDLKYDAERDLEDIGAGDIPVHFLKEMSYGTIRFQGAGKYNRGIIFATYASLVGSRAGKSSDVRDTRLGQLLEWCGDDFDGAIVFDESHKAKNLLPVGASQPSKTGKSVLELQNKLKLARIVYSSATGASEPQNMAYMTRLGIWGKNSPFGDCRHFLNSVNKRGVGAMEIVAMDLKLRGMYIARQLSFAGCSFRIEEINFTPVMQQAYNESTKLWVKLMEEFRGVRGLLHKMFWGQYWGAHQRFFKYMCIAAKVQHVVEVAKDALEDGKCVVIGMQTTGEAATNREVDKFTELDDFVSTAKGVLEQLVKKHFPVEVAETKAQLLGEIETLGRILPPNTLDQLIDEMGGPRRVAEMTGRKGRIVQDPDTGKVAYESRAEGDSLEKVNLREKEYFMQGHKLVAIITEAASCGISLQADRRVRNQRRRVHMTLELPWAADKAIQQFGRTHRSNQVCAPEYILLVTDLAGERRFAAIVAKRLESLGALLHGDRRATENRDLSRFNIDDKYGRTALVKSFGAIMGFEEPMVSPPDEYFFEDIQDDLRGIGLIGEDGELTDTHKDMAKFLNRILGIPVVQQNEMFNYFNRTRDALIDEAKRNGKFEDGILDVGLAEADRVTNPKTQEFALANGVNKIELYTLEVERSVSWEDALGKLKEYSGEKDGFYLAHQVRCGKRSVILAYLITKAKREKDDVYFFIRPNTGQQVKPEIYSELCAKYEKVIPDKAEKDWRGQFDHADKYCNHAYWSNNGTCKRVLVGIDCDVGKRRKTYYVLAGAILSVWTEVESIIGDPKKNGKMQVVRVKLPSGQRIVGTLVPSWSLERLVKKLSEWQSRVTETHQQLGFGGEKYKPSPISSTSIDKDSPYLPKGYGKSSSAESSKAAADYRRNIASSRAESGTLPDFAAWKVDKPAGMIDAAQPLSTQEEKKDADSSDDEENNPASTNVDKNALRAKSVSGGDDSTSKKPRAVNDAEARDREFATKLQAEMDAESSAAASSVRALRPSPASPGLRRKSLPTSQLDAPQQTTTNNNQAEERKTFSLLGSRSLVGGGGAEADGDGWGKDSVTAPPTNPYAPAGGPKPFEFWAKKYGTQNKLLVSMGFDEERSNIRALKATAGNVNAAVDQLIRGQTAPSSPQTRNKLAKKRLGGPAAATTVDLTDVDDEESSSWEGRKKLRPLSGW